MIIRRKPAQHLLIPLCSGTYSITLKDTSGKDLDTYVIDPKTGKGVNAANESVDLPQTGNNAPDSLLMMIAAMLLTGLGWLTAKHAKATPHKDRLTAQHAICTASFPASCTIPPSDTYSIASSSLYNLPKNLRHI